MTGEHWTTEEYRKYMETGRMPEKKAGNVKRFTAEESVKEMEKCKATAHIEDEVSRWPYVFGKQEKRRKYGNEPVTVDGIRFDSKHEAAVYQELMLKVKAGELKCVCRQVKFDLGGGPYASEDTQYKYIADFVTIDKEDRIQVLDAKSVITRKNRVYLDKKKRMLAQWGLEIVEV